MRAFSTLELMIALMITSTTLAAVVLVALGLPQALAEGHQQELAVSKANDLLERSIYTGLHSFSSLTSQATTTTDGFDTSLTSTLFADGYTKQLTSTVHWITLQGQSEYATLTALITDYQHAPINSCGQVLRGDWTHPEVSIFSVSNGALLPNTTPIASHPITSLALGTSTLIAAVSSSINKTDPTLFLFDIASSTHPVYLSSLDTATSTKTGVASVVTQGPYVYTATASAANFATCTTGPSCTQLQIVNIRTSTSPVVVDNFQLATTTFPFALGSGGQSAGKSIAYANGFIYLGLQKTGSTQGEEFNIIDVHVPTKPVWVGGYSVGRSINQIQILNNLAYLATDDPTRELIILDVHDPAHPTLVSSYDAPGANTYGFGEAVSISSSTVFLGRSYSPNGPGFSMLSTATSSIPSVVTTQNESTSVAGMVLQRFLTFVVTSSEVQFWNSTDPQHLSPYAPTIPLPQHSTASSGGLVCKNSVLYVASSDADHTGYLSVITGS